MNTSKRNYDVYLNGFDLTTSNYYLFPKLKNTREGVAFHRRMTLKTVESYYIEPTKELLEKGLNKSVSVNSP